MYCCTKTAGFSCLVCFHEMLTSLTDVFRFHGETGAKEDVFMLSKAIFTHSGEKNRSLTVVCLPLTAYHWMFCQQEVIT